MLHTLIHKTQSMIFKGDARSIVIRLLIGVLAVTAIAVTGVLAVLLLVVIPLFQSAFTAAGSVMPQIIQPEIVVPEGTNVAGWAVLLAALGISIPMIPELNVNSAIDSLQQQYLQNGQVNPGVLMEQGEVAGESEQE